MRTSETDVVLVCGETVGVSVSETCRWADAGDWD